MLGIYLFTMCYLFSKHLLLRMPVKRPADYAAESQSFLDDPAFLSALYLASASFFRSLEQQDFQAQKLTEKEKITLRKYINRYCFRPTPFGLFSSVMLMQWGTSPEKNIIDEKTVFQTSVHAGQGYQLMLSQDLLNKELAQAGYESNPSLYRALNEYRFFRTGLDEKFKQREYLLQSIAFSSSIKDLIIYCRQERSKPEIIHHIMQTAGCTPADAAEYAEFLTDAQLLVSRLRPNITGRDYLQRLTDMINTGQPEPKRFLELSQLTAHPIKASPFTPGIFQAVTKQLNELLPENVAKLNTDPLSVILYRSTEDQSLYASYQQQLRDGLYALDTLAPKDHLPAMDLFIRSFRDHFEGQTLPLLAAMDPETGIGYQETQPEKNNTLLDTLHIPYKKQPDTGPNWTAVHALLLESWLRNNQAGKLVIRLEDKDLQKLKDPGETPDILGISILFRVLEKQLVIESAGGINAPALMGRFTVGDEAIHQAAKNMARQLEQQNPGIIFAELLHLADPHVDNVNRRQSIYSYELPVTAASLLPAAQQLELSDLYIRIENNKVLLFSGKHRKPVIPRLTSAYNHSLNQLPLFRFLADIPYQYGRYNLSLDIRGHFPGLSFYPRVVYRETILSPATWIISAVQLNALQQQEPGQIISAFNRLSDAIRLPKFFLLAEGDQQLVFKGNEDKDILFFCGCVRQKEEAVLKEFFEQEAIQQFNTYVLPAEPLDLFLPQSLAVREAQAADKAKRRYLPGSEWLYLKIYAPKIGADPLLIRLQPLLNKRYRHGKISKWFFIRYDDHAPHIRLRLQVAPEAISEILLAFKTKLEDRIQQHVVREYQIDVYTRELERYTAAGMEQTENLFWRSSQLVLSFLKQNRYKTAGTAHFFALYSTSVMIKSFLPDYNDQLKFTFSGYRQFLREFADRPVKIELDKKYRELSKEIYSTLQTEDLSLLSGSLKAGQRFVRTLADISEIVTPESNDRINYLSSIIHMHLNRLFTAESRKQEMITYYLLYKYQLSLRGRNKNLRLLFR